MSAKELEFRWLDHSVVQEVNEFLSVFPELKENDSMEIFYVLPCDALIANENVTRNKIEKAVL